MYVRTRWISHVCLCMYDGMCMRSCVLMKKACKCVLMQETHGSSKIVEDITARDDDDDCGARMM